MQVNEFLNQFESLVISIPGVRLPEIIIEEKYKKLLGLKNESNNFEFLHALVSKGFKNLGFKKNSEDWIKYGERVKYELNIIEELGFTDYILIVWDVTKFCLENDIPIGPGRGSGVSSIILYLLGITKIDPIKHGLYFERFISKLRAKKQIIDGITYLDGGLLPDVDGDYSYFRRQDVLRYLEEKYKGKTSKILTLNTLSSKLLIKELGKIVGNKEEQEMTTITALIPKLHGVVEDVEKAYETVPQFKKWCEDNKNVYNVAIKLKELNKNFGVHASGVLISFEKLEDSCPTQLTSDKELVSSYDMNWVSTFCLKLDILGLRCISVIDDICKSLKINPDKINTKDDSIYQSLQDLKTPHGIFQIETDATFNATKKIKPKNLEELSAVIALSRPGAMQFIDSYATFSNTGVFQSIHPFFDDILKETGGICIFQEQAIQMANKIGFTKDEGELIRRDIGKKKTKEIKLWEEKIKNKILENKLDTEIGDIFWRILSDSAGYQFNKSHSAAYASLSATTLYLKFNYPQQFFLSLLKMTKHEPNSIAEISKIHKEMSVFNIELLPPSLTKSQMEFSIEENNIRFGLSSIKGISEKTMIKMDDFKRGNCNKFELFESAASAGLSIGVLAALIQAGTLDEFTVIKDGINNRAKLVYEAQLWNLLTDKEKKFALDLGAKYNYDIVSIVRDLNTSLKDEKSKPMIKDSRVATIKKHSEKYKLIYKQNNESQAFCNWYMENNLMGYVVKNKLIDIFKHKISNLVPINKVIEKKDGERCNFIGIVDENGMMGTSKNGAKYGKYSISDETGTIKTMIFNESLSECQRINGRYPKEKDIVIVKGMKKSEDCIFADVIGVQQNSIYVSFAKKSEIENF